MGISTRRSWPLARGACAVACTGALAALASCNSDGSGSGVTPDGGTTQLAIHQSMRLSVSAVDRRFVTRDHFIAAVEMQISGEPLAEAMGRQLKGFSRDFVCQEAVCSPNTYFDPALNGGVAGGGNVGRTDIAGFASAVESYEYSKQAMNNIAFESGAGTSLAFGRVLNPNGLSNTDAQAALRAWVQHLAAQADATSSVVSAGPPTAQNPLGWPGLWLTLQPFASWDPKIAASNQSTGCVISSDDNPGGGGTLGAVLNCNDYECDYTSLHLPNRASQVDMTIGPGASGWAGWKEALWTLNYLQVMHDANEAGINAVPDSELAKVGVPNNTVTGNGGVPGTFLGSSRIEGFQAGNFLQILDNQAEQWLTELSTKDGSTLSGFASIEDALAYSDGSPLRWFPNAISVTETSDASGFPRPTSYVIKSPDSELLDQAGLLGSFSSVFALTDLSNAAVGGSQPARAYFDGDPFPTQNQMPTGAATLHDRALGVMRVVVVNMARLHTDPQTGMFVDSVQLSGGNTVRGTTLSTDSAAYALLALRTARRAVDSLLTLYSNTKPDPSGAPSVMDSLPAIKGLPFGAHLDAMIGAQAPVFFEKLTTADGVAYGGWDLGKGAPTDDGTNLDAHTAAIRGLLVAYLSTGRTQYRERAWAVFRRLESSFYDPAARIYRATAGDRSATVTFTPRRFALLQAALRDTYELIAVLPGNAALASLIEDRLGRLDKLVLNGWDDRDEDQNIEWPGECAQLGKGPDGQPLGLGGLQMGERVLSGESGSSTDQVAAGLRVITTDREHDCVPEIAAVGLPAALANSITFTISPMEQP